jgi:hypothetical protein
VGVASSKLLSLFISLEIECFHSQWTQKYLHSGTKSSGWLRYWFKRQRQNLIYLFHIIKRTPPPRELNKYIAYFLSTQTFSNLKKSKFYKYHGKSRSASEDCLQLDGGFLKNEAIHCYKDKSNCQIEAMKITLPIPNITRTWSIQISVRLTSDRTWLSTNESAWIINVIIMVY